VLIPLAKRDKVEFAEVLAIWTCRLDRDARLTDAFCRAMATQVGMPVLAGCACSWQFEGVCRLGE